MSAWLLPLTLSLSWWQLWPLLCLAIICFCIYHGTEKQRESMRKVMRAAASSQCLPGDGFLLISSNATTWKLIIVVVKQLYPKCPYQNGLSVRRIATQELTAHALRFSVCLSVLEFTNLCCKGVGEVLNVYSHNNDCNHNFCSQTVAVNFS